MFAQADLTEKSSTSTKERLGFVKQLAEFTKETNEESTLEELLGIQARLTEWKKANAEKIKSYDNVQAGVKKSTDAIQKRLKSVYDAEVRTARNKAAVKAREESNKEQATAAQALHSLLARQAEATTDIERDSLREQTLAFIESYDDREGNYELFVDAAKALNRELADAEVESAHNRAAVEARQKSNAEQASAAKALHDLIVSQADATTQDARSQLRDQVQAFIGANEDKGGNHQIFVDRAKQLNVELSNSEVETARNQAAVEAREASNAEQAESAKGLHDLLVAQSESLTSAERQETLEQTRAYIEANDNKGGNYEVFVDRAKGLVKELTDAEIEAGRSRAAVEARQALNTEQADAAKQLHTLLIAFSEATTVQEVENLSKQNDAYIAAFEGRGGAFDVFVDRAKELDGDLVGALQFTEFQEKFDELQEKGSSAFETLALDAIDFTRDRNVAIEVLNEELVDLESGNQDKIAELQDKAADRTAEHLERIEGINKDANDKIADLFDDVIEARAEGEEEEARKILERIDRINASREEKLASANKRESDSAEKHQESVLAINKDFADKRLKVEEDLAEASKPVFTQLMDFYIEELKRFLIAQAAAKTGELITGQLLQGGQALGLGDLLGIGGSVAGASTAATGAAATGAGAVASGAGGVGGVAAALSAILPPVAALAATVVVFDQLGKAAARFFDARATDYSDPLASAQGAGGFGAVSFSDIPEVNLNFDVGDLDMSGLASSLTGEVTQLSPEEITAIFQNAGLTPSTPAFDVGAYSGGVTPDFATTPASELGDFPDLLIDKMIMGFSDESTQLNLSDETIEMLKPEPVVNLLEQSQNTPLKTTTDEIMKVQVVNESLPIEAKAGTTVPVTLGGETLIVRSDGSEVPVRFTGTIQAEIDFDEEQLYITQRDAGVSVERVGQ